VCDYNVRNECEMQCEKEKANRCHPLGTQRLRYDTRQQHSPVSVISVHNSILAASLKLHYSGCCTIHTFYTIVISEFFQADGQCFISGIRSYARKSRVHCGCLPSAPFIPQVTNCNLQCTLRHSAIILDRAHRVNFETMIKLESMIKFQ